MNGTVGGGELYAAPAVYGLQHLQAGTIRHTGYYGSVEGCAGTQPQRAAAGGDARILAFGIGGLIGAYVLQVLRGHIALYGFAIDGGAYAAPTVFGGQHRDLRAVA